MNFAGKMNNNCVYLQGSILITQKTLADSMQTPLQPSKPLTKKAENDDLPLKNKHLQPIDISCAEIDPIKNERVLFSSRQAVKFDLPVIVGKKRFNKYELPKHLIYFQGPRTLMEMKPEVEPYHKIDIISTINPTPTTSLRERMGSNQDVSLRNIKPQAMDLVAVTKSIADSSQDINLINIRSVGVEVVNAYIPNELPRVYRRQFCLNHTTCADSAF